MNLLLTHKSKTIGTIAAALGSNIFCEFGIFLFYYIGLVSEVTILQYNGKDMFFNKFSCEFVANSQI